MATEFDVDGLLTLDNYGTIQATGIHVVEPGGAVDIQEAVTIGGGSITNEVGGAITSFERAITVNDSDGTGGPSGSNGDNHGNGFAPTTIDNWGVIHGGNGEAISITDTFADTITNHGAIDGSVVFANGVGTSSGDDTITNYGSIDGSVAMADGADVFNAYTGSTLSGPLDGGDGIDTLNLDGSGHGSIGDVVNVEIVNVNAGDWTLASEGFDTINFAAGPQNAAARQCHNQRRSIRRHVDGPRRRRPHRPRGDRSRDPRDAQRRQCAHRRWWIIGDGDAAA